ncbi:MAG: 50S ribosomal protein L40e [Candidatus Aenigmatarchaeota archaeon]
MKAKYPQEVADRLFKNVYVCLRCGAKIRTQNPEKTKCRRCGYKKFRPKSKERRTISSK